MGLTQSVPKKESTRLGYVPSVGSLLASVENVARHKRPAGKVLVVGAGCAGLGAAWHLNRAGVDVTVYESLEKLGGHANTLTGNTFL